MVTRRTPKPEAVTHEAIMARLEQGEARFEEIDRRFDEFEAAMTKLQETVGRLSDAAAHFAESVQEMKRDVKPVSDLVEALGGEEQFQELAVDAARGLAALTWTGRKIGRVMKWAAVVVAGVTATAAAIKFTFFDMWKVG